MTHATWESIAAGMAAVALVAIGMPVAGSQTGGGGAIEGRITTEVAGPGAPLMVTAGQAVCGETVPDESLVLGSGRGVANAVVVVTGTRGPRAGRGPLRLGNRGCRLDPHVQLARPGATIEISSDDETMHHLHAYGADGQALFVAFPQPGATVVRQVTDPGVVRLGCGVHPWMQAWVYVTGEIAAITDTDGHYRLERVPPGPHEIRVWHERLAAEARRVFVPSGRPLTVDFELWEPTRLETVTE